MVTIDGAMGEGGGQILRTSLALSTCLLRPFHIRNIRAARRRPGLQPQHLAAVRAAAAISRAHVEGAERDSQELVFRPAGIVPGDYHFAVGTAGSATLVLQTVLPALMLAGSPSTLIVEGGTHNPYAPPFEFLQRVFLPLLNNMGPEIELSLERPGFAPQGSGCIHASIKPCQQLRPLELAERGSILEQYAEVILAHLPEHIALRELGVIGKELGYGEGQLLQRHADESTGPGNAVSVVIRSEHITEQFTAFGQRGIRAEYVAGEVVREVRRYLQAGVPVGSHLADQLLLPMALAGAGLFVTLRPSSHMLTNREVITRFLDTAIQSRQIGDDAWEVAVSMPHT